VNFLGRPLLGRFVIVLIIIQLRIIFLTVELWTPNSLQVALKSLPD